MVNIHDLNVDINILQEHSDTLKVCESTKYFIEVAVLIDNVIKWTVFVQAVQRELLGREEEVQSLQQISSHILHVEQGEESMEAKEKVHVINNKLRLLLRQISHDLNTLKTRLVSTKLPVCAYTHHPSLLSDVLANTCT